MTEALMVIIACPDAYDGEKIADRLLSKKLAACVQILPPVTSLYLWPPKKGTVEEAREILLIAKTIASRWPALEKTVLELHPYDAPEIIAVPLAHVTKKYLSWLTEELS